MNQNDRSIPSHSLQLSWQSEGQRVSSFAESFRYDIGRKMISPLGPQTRLENVSKCLGRSSHQDAVACLQNTFVHKIQDPYIWKHLFEEFLHWFNDNSSCIDQPNQFLHSFLLLLYQGKGRIGPRTWKKTTFLSFGSPSIQKSYVLRLFTKVSLGLALRFLFDHLLKLEIFQGESTGLLWSQITFADLFISTQHGFDFFSGYHCRR